MQKAHEVFRLHEVQRDVLKDVILGGMVVIVVGLMFGVPLGKEFGTLEKAMLAFPF